MEDTKLNTLYKEVEITRNKEQLETEKQRMNELVSYKRVYKLASVCETGLVKCPKRKLFRKDRCPECASVLSCFDVYSDGDEDVFFILHSTCTNCSYEYAEKKGWPTGFS